MLTQIRALTPVFSEVSPLPHRVEQRTPDDLIWHVQLAWEETRDLFYNRQEDLAGDIPPPQRPLGT